MSIAANNPFFSRSFPATTLSQVDQEFRQWLHQRGFWSENAERLFLYLTQNQHMPSPISSQQKQLLEQVIEDALDGVNITERYPAFFRDLLHSALLRREFIHRASQSPQL
jgi:hypothetical protein